MIYLSSESDDKINDVIQKIENNEKVSDKETVKKMKQIKKLNEILTTEDLTNDDDDNEETLNEGLSGMESILENTGIGKIAKDITEELDI